MTLPLSRAAACLRVIVPTLQCALAIFVLALASFTPTTRGTVQGGLNGGGGGGGGVAVEAAEVAEAVAEVAEVVEAEVEVEAAAAERRG